MINKIGLSLALSCLVTCSACCQTGSGERLLDRGDGLRSVRRMEQAIDHICIADDEVSHEQQLGDTYAYLRAAKGPEELIVMCAHFFDARRTYELQAVDSNVGPTRSECSVGDALFHLFLAKFYDAWWQYMDRSFAPYFETKETALKWVRENHYDLQKMRAIFDEDKSKKG